MDIRTLMNYAKIASVGNTPFYADEFGLNSGEIISLHHWGLIRPTGNTKKVVIKPRKSYHDFTPFETEAKEWVVIRNTEVWAVNIANELAQSLEKIQFFTSVSD